MDYLLLRHRTTPDIHKLSAYGDYAALRQAVTSMTPDEVVNVVKASGLRGRGGAAFPTGLKWSFVPKDRFPHYVCVNGDESEPGTFKDRELMEFNPHQVIEGSAIAAFAIGATRVYHYLRGEFQPVARRMQAAIDEAYAAGFLGKHVFGSAVEIQIVLHLGAGAYICGEETALLESLEGKIGMPRMRPPFPAVEGLYGQPTVINNTETLANVPYIILNGTDAYRKFGTEKSPGVKIACLSGTVRRPGNYEFELGKLTFRDLIFGEEYGQGLVELGRSVKAIMPSGASSTLLTEAALDTVLDYESVQQAGSMLGSASVIIMDDTVDVAWAAHKVTAFFKHESCGKCTPCREGTHWMLRTYEDLAAGKGEKADIESLGTVAGQMVGKCFCPLGEFATGPVLSSLKLFKADYEAKVDGAKAAAKPAAAKQTGKADAHVTGQRTN
ncbi:MAG TPA: NADH-quinone oxidoreductase subunit NuoF [Anaerolineae bacterium]|nr:NADH-quinone oxidoreductase subunit NuoF [Anaerolineae bacterium]